MEGKKRGHKEKFSLLKFPFRHARIPNLKSLYLAFSKSRLFAFLGFDERPQKSRRSRPQSEVFLRKWLQGICANNPKTTAIFCQMSGLSRKISKIEIRIERNLRSKTASGTFTSFPDLFLAGEKFTFGGLKTLLAFYPTTRVFEK